MSIRQSRDDWYKPHFEGRYNFTDYPVRRCLQEDFGSDERSVKLFETWNGITILCPHAEDLGNFYLHGDLASMIVDHIQFNIKKCVQSERNEEQLPCKSDEEIREFIKDIQVDAWIMQKSVNFEIHGEEPVIHVV